jgi:hypothetical protein
MLKSNLEQTPRKPTNLTPIFPFLLFTAINLFPTAIEAKPNSNKITVETDQQIAQNYANFIKKLRNSLQIRNVTMFIKAKNGNIFACSGGVLTTPVPNSLETTDQLITVEHCITGSPLLASGAVSRLSQPLTEFYGKYGNVSESLISIDTSNPQFSKTIIIVENTSKYPVFKETFGNNFESNITDLDPANPLCPNFDTTNPVVSYFNGARSNGQNLRLIDIFLKKSTIRKKTTIEPRIGNSGGLLFGQPSIDSPNKCIIGANSALQQSYMNYSGTNTMRIIRMTDENPFVQSINQALIPKF